MLSTIIEGFEAWHRNSGFVYDDIIGKSPNPNSYPKKEWEKLWREYCEKLDHRRDKDHKKAEEGLKLFAEYFGCFWD